MKCLFGHKWNGCKCVKCSKIRDEEHNYIPEGKYIQKCGICGKVNYAIAITLLLGYAAGGTTRFPLASEQEIKEIGKKLNEAGGSSLMKEVHDLFMQHLPYHANHLKKLWDDIG
jgi:hypothetical protein